MDIREILNALSPEDKALWSQHRTEMRRTYLNAHSSTLGMVKWDANDDAFIDMIDIKLATLFDRSGKLEGITKDIIGASDVAKTEEALANHKLKNAWLPAPSTATASMQNDNWSKQA